jgi:ABC-type multidrug transport system fused ATPase/permease subunit
MSLSLIQCSESGAPLWARGQGIPQGAHDPSRAPHALHHPLEFQSFRGAGRDRPRARLYQSLMNVLAVKLIAERRQDLSASLTLEHGKLLGSTIGAIRTIETLKASGLEDDSFAYWAGIQAKALNAEQDLGFYSATLEIFPTLFSGLTMAAILGVGGLRVIEGALTLGGLVAFQSLMASFSGPITSLVQLAGSVQTMNGGLARLDDVYNYPARSSSVRSHRSPADICCPKSPRQSSRIRLPTSTRISFCSKARFERISPYGMRACPTSIYRGRSKTHRSTMRLRHAREITTAM